jgi:hypothetical protein
MGWAGCVGHRVRSPHCTHRGRINPCTYLSSRFRAFGYSYFGHAFAKVAIANITAVTTGSPPLADTTPYTTRWLPTFLFHLASKVWYACYNVSVHRSLLHCHRFPSRGSVLEKENTRSTTRTKYDTRMTPHLDARQVAHDHPDPRGGVSLQLEAPLVFRRSPTQTVGVEVPPLLNVQPRLPLP